MSNAGSELLDTQGSGRASLQTPYVQTGKRHNSEHSLEQRGAASNVLKTDSEVPKARAPPRRLPEAEQLSRTRRGIDRDRAYARGDAHARDRRESY